MTAANFRHYAANAWQKKPTRDVALELATAWVACAEAAGRKAKAIKKTS